MKKLLIFILLTISFTAFAQTFTDTTSEQKIIGSWEICQAKADADLFSQIIYNSLNVDTLTFIKNLSCESSKLGMGYYYFNGNKIFEYGYSPYEGPRNDGMLNGIYIKVQSHDGNIKPNWIYNKENSVLKINLNDRNNIQFTVVTVTEKELILKMIR